MSVQQSVETLFPMECGCCLSGSGGDEASLGCFGDYDKSAIFTSRELAILERIREAGAKARNLKSRIRQANAGGLMSQEGLADAEKELEDLRRTRADLEEARLAAWEERMRYLGHL